MKQPIVAKKLLEIIVQAADMRLLISFVPAGFKILFLMVKYAHYVQVEVNTIFIYKDVYFAHLDIIIRIANVL